MAASTSYSAPKYSLQSNDSQSVQSLIQNITSNIVKITQHVNQIENYNLQIGTRQDSDQLRDKLFHAEKITNQLAKETSKCLKELNEYVKNSASNHVNSFGSEEKQIKIHKERLTNELVKALNKFQEVQKSTMQKQKESNERAKANLVFNVINNKYQQHANNDEAFRLHTMSSSDQMNMTPFDSMVPNQNESEQKQTQITMESDVNLEQLREREAALRRLESDITDVNIIFKDLAVMVHSQGEIIDSIESNVEQVQISVNEANNQLESARKNQSKARKKKFILVSILSGVVAVILLILILSLQPWN